MGYNSLQQQFKSIEPVCVSLITLGLLVLDQCTERPRLSHVVLLGSWKQTHVKWFNEPATPERSAESGESAVS